MKKITVIFVLAGICLLGNLNLAHSEIKAYLYIDGVNGESRNASYPNWINILSWSWQMSQSGGTAGTGKVIVRDLVVKKLIDKASPLLILALLNGKHIYEARLALQQQSGNPYEMLIIKMQDVVLSNISSDSNSGLTMEAVALNFAKFCYKYTPLKPDGRPDVPIGECW